jgi:hypothetical protein
MRPFPFACAVLFALGFALGWSEMRPDFFAAVCAGGVPVVAVLLVRAMRSHEGEV